MRKSYEPPAGGETSLIERLDAATELDLEEVREQIAACERRLESLRVLERVMDVRLHGRPQKVAWGGRKKTAPAADAEGNGHAAPAGGTKTSGYRETVRKYLGRVGAAKPAVIAADCGIPTGSITSVLGTPEFTRDPASGHVKLAS